MGKKWKKAERELLAKLVGEGFGLADIEIPGRTYERIRRKARRMGLIAPMVNPPWSRAEIRKLRKLRAQGLSAEQIASCGFFENPRRTQVGIQKTFTKLGLSKGKRSDAAKRRRIWQGSERAEFDDFLRKHSKELSAQQIGEIFGVKAQTVSSRQRQLGAKPSLKEVMALPEVRRNMLRGIKERSQKKIANFDKYIEERRQSLETLAEEMAGNRPQKKCRGYGHSWPKHSKFFFHYTVKSKGMTCWYFNGLCKICVSRQRYKKRREKSRGSKRFA